MANRAQKVQKVMVQPIVSIFKCFNPFQFDNYIVVMHVYNIVVFFDLELNFQIPSNQSQSRYLALRE